PRVLTEKCWDGLLNEAKHGATVAISGAIDLDEYWLPVERSKLFGAMVQTEPISPSETIKIGSQEYLTRFEGEKMQRIEKAVTGSQAPIIHSHGSGKIVWSPLPLELGDSMEALVAFYKEALAEAGVGPIFTASPATPAVLILPAVFRDVVLYTFVSEIDRDTQLTVTHHESRTRFDVLVPAERTATGLIERRSGLILS